MNNKILEYFKGKPCSIFTRGINRNFKEEDPSKLIENNIFYFVGVIEEVDQDGILITQTQTGFKSYFFKNSLVAICEEEYLDPTIEKDQKIITAIKDKDKQAKDLINKYKQNPSGTNLEDLNKL